MSEICSIRLHKVIYLDAGVLILYMFVTALCSLPPGSSRYTEAGPPSTITIKLIDININLKNN